jgi:hypothetical protein
MDKLETELKNFFLKKRTDLLKGAERASAAYPDATDLYLFVMDRLEGQALRRMLDYLKSHPDEQALVAQARELAEHSEEIEKEKVSLKAIQKAKSLVAAQKSPLCPHCGKPVTVFKKPLLRQRLENSGWLLGAVAAFGLSFVFKRYFMQCLVLALLAAVKWIVDERATRTRVMIYKALKEDSSDESKDLHRTAGRL